MWIFTSGLNIGMSKAVGDDFEEDYIIRNSRICTQHSKEKTAPKLPLIGLCTDTMLTYHDQFETPVCITVLVPFLYFNIYYFTSRHSRCCSG